MDNICDDIRLDLIKFISLFHRLFKPVFQREDDDVYMCSKNQIKAIMIIGRAKAITPSVLGKCMDMEKGSITSLVESMEKLGLVYKSNDLNDKRKIWIYLTEEGEKYFNKQEKRFVDQIELLFSCIPKEDINEFSQNLKNVVSTLEKVRGE